MSDPTPDTVTTTTTQITRTSISTADGSTFTSTTRTTSFSSSSTSASPSATTSTPTSRSEQKSSGKLHPGITLTQATTSEIKDAPSNHWTEIAGPTFHVRTPGYAIHKKKAASDESLFSLQAVDMYSAESKICNIGECVDLPGDRAEFASSSSRPLLPATFIVNWQIPSYAPANPIWGATKEDGTGYSLVFYYVLSEVARAEVRAWETYQALSEQEKEATTAPVLRPSLRLLHRFINAEPGDELRARYKAITRVVNAEECNLGGAAKKLVQTYNGTPFLIRTTSVFFRGDNYFEIDVDVHRFSYLARVGLNGLRERVRDVIFDFAFVIQGDSDDELPEQILSAARLFKLDDRTSIKFPDKYCATHCAAAKSQQQ